MCSLTKTLGGGVFGWVGLVHGVTGVWGCVECGSALLQRLLPRLTCVQTKGVDASAAQPAPAGARHSKTQEGASAQPSASKPAAQVRCIFLLDAANIRNSLPVAFAVLSDSLTA